MVTVLRSPAMLMPTVNSSVMPHLPRQCSQHAADSTHTDASPRLLTAYPRTAALRKRSGSLTPTPLPMGEGGLPRDLGDLAHDLERAGEPVGELFEIVRDDDAHIGADTGALALGADPSDQRDGIGERLVAEGERQALRAGLELLDIGAPAERLDLHQLHEQVDLGGRGAEAVDDFRSHRLDLALVLERREAAIESEPRRQIGNIRFGNRYRRAKLDGRRPHVLGRRLLAQLDALDRLAHHLLIEFVADLLDMAGLLLAEQVAGAAQVEIVARELKARAQHIERLKNGEPLLRLGRDLGLGRRGEIGVGANLRPADPAPQLVELRKPEHVGAMHDHGVGAWNVEAGFDDRRRQEDVVLAVVEGADL